MEKRMEVRHLGERHFSQIDEEGQGRRGHRHGSPLFTEEIAMSPDS